MISRKVLASSLALMTLCVGAETNRPVMVGIHGSIEPDAIPMWSMMYGVFSRAVGKDNETPGEGVRYVKDIVRIADDATAQALFTYMHAAYYAARASSRARLQEFCGLDVATADALVDALEERRRTHEAQVDRLMMGAADVVDTEVFDALIQYIEAHRSWSGLVSTDYETTYANADAKAEFARMCQHASQTSASSN